MFEKNSLNLDQPPPSYSFTSDAEDAAKKSRNIKTQKLIILIAFAFICLFLSNYLISSLFAKYHRSEHNQLVKKNETEKRLSDLHRSLTEKLFSFHEEMDDRESKLNKTIGDKTSSLIEIVGSNIDTIKSLMNEVFKLNEKIDNQAIKLNEKIDEEINQNESKLTKIVNNKVTDLIKMIKGEKDKLKESFDEKLSDFRQETDDIELKLNRMVNDKTSDLSSQINDNVNIIEKKIANLKDENEKKIKYLDIYRSEATVVFEFDEIIKFLANSFDKYRRSDFFYVRSIAWYVEYKVVHQNYGKKLRLNLCAVPTDEIKWSIDATYKFKILNQFYGKNLELAIHHGTFSKSSKCSGFAYVSFDQLISDRLIGKNKMKLEVYIKVDKFSRDD